MLNSYGGNMVFCHSLWMACFGCYGIIGTELNTVVNCYCCDAAGIRKKYQYVEVIIHSMNEDYFLKAGILK